MTQLRKIYGV